MRACHKINYVVLAIFLWMVGGMIVCNAQIAEHVYRTDYHINPENDGALFFELDNISFFKNNEYAGSMMDGYTLPGLGVQPKLVYYPFENIKLEAGAHMLRFWGANRYPNYAYQDIAEWKGSQFQKGFHVLPFFRVQVALSEHVDVVLGSLYGGSNHHLIEPLYNPELNLSADPEAGLQLLYTSKHIESSAKISERIYKAQTIQTERYKNEDINFNSELNSKKLKKYCQINQKSKSILEKLLNNNTISIRGYCKILKLARTIADLSCDEKISTDHILEAIHYKNIR